MKKFIFILFVTILAGCGAVQQAQLKNASQQAQMEISEVCNLFLHLPEKEAMAWHSSQAAMDKCFSGISGSPTPEKILYISECGENVMNEYIRPYANSKSLFDKLIEERRLENEKYARGDITNEQRIQSSANRLDNYFQKAEGGSYFNYANCHNSILNEQVFPVYPNELKPSLSKFQSELLAMSRDADKSGMEIEDYQIGYQRLWSQFASNEQEKINQVNAKNAQAWQDFSKQLQQTSQQINQQQAMHAQQCGSLDIAPMASIGCKNVCINGKWAEVC